MADAISLASGILALAVFALHSSQRLYSTISSFKSNKRVVRELSEELIALDGVLKSLQDTINANNSDLTALKLPLLRCGKACQEFELIISKCSTDSGGVRAIRDWARVFYMGDDITGFRVLIAGYKSTITIAICEVNMRTTNITANLLSEYKTLIEQTSSDLEERLDLINKKLDDLTISHTPNLSSIGTQGRTEEGNQEVIEEKKSIEKCLEICVQVSEHIDRVRSGSILKPPATSSGASSSSKAAQITTDALDGCKIELSNTASALQQELRDIQLRLAALTSQPEFLGDPNAEEIESIKQCLNICSKASEQVKNDRIFVFEDIKTEDDGEQIIVATMGDLLSAKRVTSGSRSTQWLGQMSDASLQYLAGQRKSRSISPPNSQSKPHGQNTKEFEGRHGTGQKLK
ncbi:hypothetical protein H072_265 [Dactylellina haptotyla CBS 200.50]|uniref:Azaphilone pigments biosynthesis cluster protein L N-terminal domain-containing protein n=1 Tax=Dactylellina haptotyla (strain CBS 200.50) TaxID=1284197 RepID=S8AS56_DACHA|nr:hypothetical protein H072_265 [Dactylellina haptotyla CBS 200.50]